MSNCHPLEVVGRGSETQLQVSENLNTIPTKKDIDPMLVNRLRRWPTLNSTLRESRVVVENNFRVTGNSSSGLPRSYYSCTESCILPLKTTNNKRQ